MRLRLGVHPKYMTIDKLFELDAEMTSSNASLVKYPRAQQKKSKCGI